jgi:predicted secreted Zn-dependent protease
MIHNLFRHLSCIAFFLGSTAAVAKDTSSFIFYPVSGKTAPLVYEDIKAHAPRVAQNATFAFTMIATKTDKKEAKSAQSCRYKSFKTSAIFNFVIPRHTNSDTLPPKTRVKWATFVNYLRTHEAGHRTIWINCLAEYDQQSLALKAETCADLDNTREKILNTLKRKCLAEDEAYDVQFRKAILKDPFVAEALRKPITP